MPLDYITNCWMLIYHTQTHTVYSTHVVSDSVCFGIISILVGFFGEIQFWFSILRGEANRLVHLLFKMNFWFPDNYYYLHLACVCVCEVIWARMRWHMTWIGKVLATSTLYTRDTKAYVRVVYYSLIVSRTYPHILMVTDKKSIAINLK